MTDDNSFKNNPFKALEKGRFPQQKKTGAPAAPEKRGKRIARQAAVPADDEDASLFLSAMSNVERQSAHGGAARGQGAGQGGFAMEEAQGKEEKGQRPPQGERSRGPRSCRSCCRTYR